MCVKQVFVKCYDGPSGSKNSKNGTFFEIFHISVDFYSVPFPFYSFCPYEAEMSFFSPDASNISYLRKSEHYTLMFRNVLNVRFIYAKMI